MEVLNLRASRVLPTNKLKDVEILTVATWELDGLQIVECCSVAWPRKSSAAAAVFDRSQFVDHSIASAFKAPAGYNTELLCELEDTKVKIKLDKLNEHE